MGLVKCPKCGREFDVMYARAYSCKGCSILALRSSCTYIKCPYCGHEFVLR